MPICLSQPTGKTGFADYLCVLCESYCVGCAEVLTLSNAEVRLDKKCARFIAPILGKFTRHWTAETAKPLLTCSS